jgi:RHS repeat-associated protein
VNSHVAAGAYAFWPHGAALKTSYGNGLVRTAATFNQRLQPGSFWDAINDDPARYVRLEYPTWTDPNNSSHNNGNLQGTTLYEGGPAAQGNLKTFAQSFTYDALNRLSTATETSASCGSSASATCWFRDQQYDAYGNMWVAAPDGTQGYYGFQPNINVPLADNYNTSNQRTDLGVNAYDAAGNLQVVLSAPNIGLSYDAESRIVAAGPYSYDYDGEGRRVTKSAGGATTVYVYDASGALAAEYNSGAAVNAGCATCYLSYDYLGSVRLITDGTGKVVSRHDYLPFGEEVPAGSAGRDASWGMGLDDVTQRFTAKERDSESGLDYFGARYYGSALGRFTSPDPSRLSAFIDSPQSWNMYSYGYNNPFSFIDKNGRWPTGIHNQIIDSAFPNLTAHQRQILKDVSANQDGLLNGGQSGPLSFQHAMRGPGESADDAKAEYDAFVSLNEDMAFQTQMSFWAAGNPGLSDDALAEFAAALHAIEDSTSPAHAGFQVWEWWNPKLVWQHHWAENSISPQQMNNSVAAARNAFNATFHPQMNQFDLLQLIVQPQKEEVKSKICYNTEDGKKVCQ